VADARAADAVAAEDRAAPTGTPSRAPVVRALLFDLDGTLADTAAANHSAYAGALAEVGVRVDRTTFARVADGRNWRQFLPELLGAAGVEADPERIARRKAELYRETVGELRLNTPLLALAAAARRTMATALVTTASGANARAILDAHALHALFTAVVTGDDVTEHKPHPEAYLLAAARIGVEPGECVAFEDSDIGVTSARAAGVPVVRVAL
jgi:HAD superfamily hydrolase (TIGR01509 family)